MSLDHVYTLGYFGPCSHIHIAILAVALEVLTGIVTQHYLYSNICLTYMYIGLRRGDSKLKKDHLTLLLRLMNELKYLGMHLDIKLTIG